MVHNKILNIRKANKKDISTIVRVHKECVSQTNAKAYLGTVIKEWLKQISEQNVLDQLGTTTWLILAKESKIIGFSQYDLKKEELYQIQILPEYQKSEYGKYFYDFIEEDFIKNKKSKITLFATLNAVPFYKSVGFNRIKTVKFPLGNKSIEMVKMCKDIKAEYLIKK